VTRSNEDKDFRLVVSLHLHIDRTFELSASLTPTALRFDRQLDRLDDFGSQFLNTKNIACLMDRYGHVPYTAAIHPRT
jgi:hypothetical protein